MNCTYFFSFFSQISVFNYHVYIFAIYRGHLDLLQRVEEGMKRNPGLLLGGNYRTGVAFGDCVQYGANVAKEIAQMLNNR